MFDPASYPIRIFRSEEDGGFIAEAIDLPGCSAFGESAAEASQEILDAISAWVDAAAAAGNDIPSPTDCAVRVSYSGKVALRLPKSLHASLSHQAKSDGVSLNTYIVHVLSEGAAMSAAKQFVLQPPAQQFFTVNVKTYVGNLARDWQGHPLVIGSGWDAVVRAKGSLAILAGAKQMEMVNG